MYKEYGQKFYLLQSSIACDSVWQVIRELNKGSCSDGPLLGRPNTITNLETINTLKSVIKSTLGITAHFERVSI